MKIKSEKQILKNILGVIIGCVLLCCFSARVHAEESYQLKELQLQGTITTDSALNVRSGPGKEYEVIGKVKNDSLLTITGQTDNGWYQIELEGETGYVSGEYVTAEEQPEQEKTIGEPEEGYRGLQQSPYVMKIAAIVAVILVILIMLILTLRGMRREDGYDDDDEDDEYDEEDEEEDEEDEDEYDEVDEDDDDEYDEDTDDEDEYDDNGEYEEDAVAKAVRKETQDRIKKREYIIREEDYRVDIDPRFFEEKEPIEQPAMVTGYLERKRIEEAIGEAEFPEGRERDKKDAGGRKQKPSEERQRELNLAMEKLDELQKEIERLKKEE